MTAIPYDFNSDGLADILLQQTSDGQVAVWLGPISGPNNEPASELRVGSAPGANWKAIGSGDFDGDGKADIVLQNTTDGSAAVWLMNSATVLSQTTVGANPGPTWKIIGAGDFNGDGKSDILWQDQTGQAQIWLMNGTSVLSQNPLPGNPGPTWRAVGAGDFDGDTKSDILWQNDNGQLMIWFMNGATVQSQSLVGTNPGVLSRVKGAGDFNGDGKADILWTNNGPGDIRLPAGTIWFMNGATIQSTADLSYTTPLGIAFPGNVNVLEDLNGDGKADIVLDQGSSTFKRDIYRDVMNGATVTLQSTVSQPVSGDWTLASNGADSAYSHGYGFLYWQNDSSRVAAWEMHGTSIASDTYAFDAGFAITPGVNWKFVAPGLLQNSNNGDIGSLGTLGTGSNPVIASPGTAWRAVEVADFRKNPSGFQSAPDILLQNSSTGQARILLLSYSEALMSNFVSSDFNLGLAPGPAWTLVGTGDFDGDGQTDLLWQNSNGQAAIWLMNGKTPAAEVRVDASPGASWRLVGAGDFDGDGKSDLLWQNSDGQAAIWLMNGTTPTAEARIDTSPGANWTVKGAEDLNGDSKADIIWQNSDGSPAAWLMSSTTVLLETRLGTNPGTSWHLFASAT